MSCQQSVASYLSDWLEIHSPGLAPSTVAGYKRSITLHIVPVCGTVPLAELSPLHILKALAPLRAAGYPRAAQLVLITLRAALKDAMRLGLIDHNPADLIALPEIPLHGLRHSMASDAIDAGCELRVLQALLGHAHLSTTADIYVHPSAAVRSAALASVVRLVVQ